MWLNYLKISLRSFIVNKLYSFINVFGLAVGLASVILIGLYVADELSYDRFHPDAGRIYRISRDFYATGGSNELHLASLAPRAAEQLKADFPEIEETARTMNAAVGLLARDDVEFYEPNIHFADPSLFRMFAFDWVVGDPATALDLPNSLVLTESIARKYFGNEPPMGQYLKLENGVDFLVTGVIRDLPGNTHLNAEIFMRLESFLSLIGPQAANRWSNNMTYTYVMLAPG